MKHDALIEAILFYRGEPVGRKELEALLGLTGDEVEKGLLELRKRLTGGIVLMERGEEAALATAEDASAIIEKSRKDELTRDLSKAASETLSLVLYRGPIGRSDIDYIRGVNSTFTLRTLMIRGLIERIQNPNDERSFLYEPSFELLSLLGVRTTQKLPEYEVVRKEFENFQNKELKEEHYGGDRAGA